MNENQQAAAERAAKRISEKVDTHSCSITMPFQNWVEDQILAELETTKPAEPVCDCGKIEHGRHHMSCPVMSKPAEAVSSLAQIAYAACNPGSEISVMVPLATSWGIMAAAVEAEVLRRVGQQMIDVKIERDKAVSQDLGLRAIIERLAVDRDHWFKKFQIEMERNSALRAENERLRSLDQPHWTEALGEISFGEDESKLVPWSDISEVPLNAWFRHKSSTTCRKIEAFHRYKFKLRDDWLTFGDVFDQYDYSVHGVLFRPCGKPAKGGNHAD